MLAFSMLFVLLSEEGIDFKVLPEGEDFNGLKQEINENKKAVWNACAYDVCILCDELQQR